MAAPDSRFVRACKCLPVDRTPIWLMRQAGRYMAEYRAVRKQYSLIEICKKPEIAAEVTITAAEILGVDAAIIFADLLLPLEVMGLPFHFSAGEGPVVEKPVRDAAAVSALAGGSRGGFGLCIRGGAVGVQAFRIEAADDWVLRGSVYFGQLHDRGRRVAELYSCQEDDVFVSGGLG